MAVQPVLGVQSSCIENIFLCFFYIVLEYVYIKKIKNSMFKYQNSFPFYFNDYRNGYA